MYSCNCGAQLKGDSIFCHRCGGSVPHDGFNTTNSHSVSPKAAAKEALIRELLAIDQKFDECHRCGSKTVLYRRDFGLEKILSRRRAWAQTAASVAVSAITMPVLGVGGRALPGKKHQLSVLRLQLVLCESCAQSKNKSYSLHPWWDAADRLGYSEFLSAEDLKELQLLRR